MWGIQMGKQELNKDRVTSLLQTDEWEDDQTATEMATTVADSNSEEEDEENPEESFEEKNKHRKPPAEPMYNGQGASIVGKNVPGAFVRAATNNAKKDRSQISAMSSSEIGTTVSKVKVVTPDVAECTAQSVHSSNGTKSTVQSMHDAAECTTQSARSNEIKSTVQSINKHAQHVRSNGIKNTVQSTNKHTEATTKQQRTEDPRHWLEVPANHLKESEMVAKRKTLTRELMG